MDVARFGDDRTALAKRQKNKLLEPVKSWNSMDLMATAGKIKAEYDATPYDARPSEILVDIIGLGAGVYDRCRELGLPVRGVNVGEAAASRENMRSPDLADAFLLTFACGERRRERYRKPEPRRRSAWAA